MRFYWANGETRDYEFGDTIRGLMLNGERPLNVYITPMELTLYIARAKAPLNTYLYQVRFALQLDGRMEIKNYDK